MSRIPSWELKRLHHLNLGAPVHIPSLPVSPQRLPVLLLYYDQIHPAGDDKLPTDPFMVNLIAHATHPYKWLRDQMIWEESFANQVQVKLAATPALAVKLDEWRSLVARLGDLYVGERKIIGKVAEWRYVFASGVFGPYKGWKELVDGPIDLAADTNRGSLALMLFLLEKVNPFIDACIDSMIKFCSARAEYDGVWSRNSPEDTKFWGEIKVVAEKIKVEWDKRDELVSKVYGTMFEDEAFVPSPLVAPDFEEQ